MVQRAASPASAPGECLKMTACSFRCQHVKLDFQFDVLTMFLTMGALGIVQEPLGEARIGSQRRHAEPRQIRTCREDICRNHFIKPWAFTDSSDRFGSRPRSEER